MLHDWFVRSWNLFIRFQYPQTSAVLGWFADTQMTPEFDYLWAGQTVAEMLEIECSAECTFEYTFRGFRFHWFKVKANVGVDCRWKMKFHFPSSPSPIAPISLPLLFFNLLCRGYHENGNMVHLIYITKQTTSHHLASEEASGRFIALRFVIALNREK